MITNKNVKSGNGGSVQPEGMAAAIYCKRGIWLCKEVGKQFARVPWREKSSFQNATGAVARIIAALALCTQKKKKKMNSVIRESDSRQKKQIKKFNGVTLTCLLRWFSRVTFWLIKSTPFGYVTFVSLIRHSNLVRSVTFTNSHQSQHVQNGQYPSYILQSFVRIYIYTWQSIVLRIHNTYTQMHIYTGAVQNAWSDYKSHGFIGLILATALYMAATTTSFSDCICK